MWNKNIEIFLSIVTGIVVPIVLFILERKNNSSSNINFNINMNKNTKEYKIIYIIKTKFDDDDSYFKNLCIIFAIIFGIFLFIKFHIVVLILLIVGFSTMTFYKKDIEIIFIMLFVTTVFFYIYPVFYTEDYITFLINNNFYNARALLAAIFQFVASMLWIFIMVVNLSKTNKKDDKIFFGFKCSHYTQLIIASLATFLMSGIIEYTY